MGAGGFGPLVTPEISGIRGHHPAGGLSRKPPGRGRLKPPPRIILTDRLGGDWNIRLTGKTICAGFRLPFFVRLWSARRVWFFKPRALRLTMNKKTKTMFVMQPGGFGSGSAVFTTYEYEDYSEVEESPATQAEVQTAPAARQTFDNRNWTQAVVRLPEVLRRSVWSPLARRVQKLAQAA